MGILSQISLSTAYASACEKFEAVLQVSLFEIRLHIKDTKLGESSKYYPFNDLGLSF